MLFSILSSFSTVDSYLLDNFSLTPVSRFILSNRDLCVSQVQLVPVSEDGSLFELDFSSAGKDANRGFYLLTISATLTPPKVTEGGEPDAVIPLIGNVGAQVELTVSVFDGGVRFAGH